MEYEDSEQKEEREFREEIVEAIHDSGNKIIMESMVSQMMRTILYSFVRSVLDEFGEEKAAETIDGWCSQLEKVMLPSYLSDAEMAVEAVWKEMQKPGATKEEVIAEKREFMGGLFQEALGDLRGMLREGLKKDEEKS